MGKRRNHNKQTSSLKWALVCGLGALAIFFANKLSPVALRPQVELTRTLIASRFPANHEPSDNANAGAMNVLPATLEARVNLPTLTTPSEENVVDRQSETHSSATFESQNIRVPSVTLRSITLTFTPTSSPTPRLPAIRPTPVTLNGIVTTPRLNVRNQPNPQGYIVYRISGGDSVHVIGRSSDNSWVLVDIGRVGWVNTEYVTIYGNLASLGVYTDDSNLPSSQVTMNFVCPGARGPSFALHQRFVVPYGDGPSSVRELPSSRVVVERVLEGRGGEIIAGPICAAGAEGLLVYWFVHTDSGSYGYISEGYSHSPIAWIVP